ncbi:hypothetical protein [Paraburkholderia youngii]|uniref:hypothetical protein n=1 Tax=Paraburkholderia youngii TaxID=2782701 RepID=UPI003D1A43FD
MDFVLEPPARVRVDATPESDIKRWNDCGAEMWCDPVWDVTLAEPHPQLGGVRSLWIHATSYLEGSDRTEASDVVEVVGDAPQCADEILEDLWQRYDFGSDAGYEDRSGWEHTSGTYLWTRPVFLRPADVSVEEFDESTSEQVTFTVRLNPDLTLNEVYVIDRHGNYVGSLPPDATISADVIAAAAKAIDAHHAALLIEGDESIQLYHLLASLHEYCASKRVDLDAVFKQVREDIESGDVQSPLWKSRQLALRRGEARRDPTGRG